MDKIFSEVVLYKKESDISDENIKFVIIVSQYDGKWVFVQHKERETWELPGWHREDWESILDWAKRELFEETWAREYEIEHAGYWSLLNSQWIKTFGSIFFATISSFWEMPNSEIGKINLFEEIPENMTYPNVHPTIFDMVVTNLY